MIARIWFHGSLRAAFAEHCPFWFAAGKQDLTEATLPMAKAVLS